MRRGRRRFGRGRLIGRCGAACNFALALVRRGSRPLGTVSSFTCGATLLSGMIVEVVLWLDP